MVPGHLAWPCRAHHHARLNVRRREPGSTRTGDSSGIAHAALGLACLAADAGDWHQAALLHGVAQAFLDRIGQHWEELEARYRQDSPGHVRAHLGQEQFDRAHAEGMALSSVQASTWPSGKTLPG